jgi:hypothetical protein
VDESLSEILNSSGKNIADVKKKIYHGYWDNCYYGA